MFHEGYALRLFIENNKKVTVEQIGKALGISRQGVGSLYGQPVLPTDYKELLKQAAFVIDGVTNEKISPNVTNTLSEPLSAYGEKHDYLLLKKELEMKELLLAAKQDTIDRLDKNLQMAIAQLGAAAKK